MDKLSHNIKKLVKSLDAAKHRKTNNLFKAEGTKCVLDTVNSFSVRFIVATLNWMDENKEKLPTGVMIYEAKHGEMEQMTAMSTAPEVIAVYEIPQVQDPDIEADELIIALDAIQDPGNLGTIVRLADWFGVKKILCGEGTADIFSPKSVMATMGAISRVKLYYCNLVEKLSGLSSAVPIYGTVLDGENVFSSVLTKGGIIVMGNEGRGVSLPVRKLFTHYLTIPSYPKGVETSESLNVAMATGIVVSQFRSRMF